MVINIDDIEENKFWLKHLREKRMTSIVIKEEKYALKSYDGPLNDLLGQCPVRHKKSDAWIKQNCISKSNPPLKCISTGLSGGLPVKTSDGFYVKLSPTYDSELWNELPEIAP